MVGLAAAARLRASHSCQNTKNYESKQYIHIQIQPTFLLGCHADPGREFAFGKRTNRQWLGPVFSLEKLQRLVAEPTVLRFGFHRALLELFNGSNAGERERSAQRMAREQQLLQ